jgi:hypothetical protein
MPVRVCVNGQLGSNKMPPFHDKSKQERHKLHLTVFFHYQPFGIHNFHRRRALS